MPHEMSLVLPDELWEWVQANAEDDGLLPDEFVRNILRMTMAMELGEEEDDEEEGAGDGSGDGDPGADDEDYVIDKDEEEK